MIRIGVDDDAGSETGAGNTGHHVMFTNKARGREEGNKRMTIGSWIKYRRRSTSSVQPVAAHIAKEGEIIS